MAPYSERTIDARARFLQLLASTGNVSESCREAKFPRRTAYDHREADPEFAAAWKDAEEVAADYLRAEARRRGVDGWDEPVFWKGEVCGHIRRYSDTMLGRLLTAHCPEFKDERNINVGGQPGNAVRVDLSKATTEQLEKLAAIEQELEQ